MSIESHFSLGFLCVFQVGVDPLLRTSIWKHLVAMSKPDEKTGKSTTIVITTHYIEEAIQSNRVGK